MALFGPSKEQRANAENEVMQKLASNEYINMLMHELLVVAGKEPVGEDENGQPVFDLNNGWITTCQSYYDNRKRTVVVGPDVFGIKWSDFHNEPVMGPNGSTTMQRVEDVHQQFGYAYTSNGYRPLHGYSNGTVAVSTKDVVKCWANVLKERMQVLFPELSFESVSVPSIGEEVTFEYSVPALTWKDWF